MQRIEELYGTRSFEDFEVDIETHENVGLFHPNGNWWLCFDEGGTIGAKLYYWDHQGPPKEVYWFDHTYDFETIVTWMESQPQIPHPLSNPMDLLSNWKIIGYRKT